MAVKAADQLSIIDVSDAYSANLSTDSFTFAGDTTKVKTTQSFTTVISALQGSTVVSAAVDVSGLSLPRDCRSSATVTRPVPR